MKNFRISARLMGGFILVTLLVVAVGLIARNMAFTVKGFRDEIVSYRLESIKALLLLNEAQTDIDATENVFLSKKIGKQDLEENFARSEAAKKRIDQALKIYAPLVRTKEEDSVWNKFLPAWQDWMRDHEKLLVFAREYISHNCDTAYEAMSAESFANDHRTYFPAKKLLEKLVAINNRVAREKNVAANRVVKRSLTTITAVIVLGAFLAILLGILITRSITVSIRKLRTAAAELGKGKLDTKIARVSNDEIGDLTATFNKMAEDLKTSLLKKKELAGVAAAAEAEKMRTAELHALNQQLRASEQELKAANQQLKAKEQALTSKMAEVERFNKVMVGRELAMIELKKKINELQAAAGMPKEYDGV